MSSRHAQDVREHYERKLERANNLYMELTNCMLQLEKREQELIKYVLYSMLSVDLANQTQRDFLSDLLQERLLTEVLFCRREQLIAVSSKRRKSILQPVVKAHEKQESVEKVVKNAGKAATRLVYLGVF